MNRKRILLGTLALGGAVALLFGSTMARSRSGADAGVTKSGVDTAEARAIATDAYLYGYPLVTAELTRRVMTNAAAPGGWNAPTGQFAHMRSYPTPEMRTVTTPNADTLYSSAWVDVSREPWVLGIPDMNGRYYMMPMLDAFSEVFEAPGTRTTGDGAQRFVITGPGWKGALPAGVTAYEAPTNIVWIIGRIYSSGTREDLDRVHALQDAMSLVPLSAYGKSYTPPRGTVDPNVDMKTPVRDQVDRLNAPSFFELMSDAMKANPPHAADGPLVARMAKIGIVPGADFDPNALSPSVAKGLDEAPEIAHDQIAEHLKKSAGRMEIGWLVPKKTGQYGTDYLARAATAAFGFGANRSADAVYPFSEHDVEGRPYDGSHAYVLRFDAGNTPPVKGFWSLTMYGEDLFFVPNELDRHALGDRSNLRRNADGSVDVYIQKDSPGPDEEDNWLPAPDGKFKLVMRLYWPNEKPPSILDGSWMPPPVKRVR